ncbi:TSUP family transporter [Qipengyuania sp. GH25]|uniref:Probable membrane transporter protein n=1 Tax=Qipengyuania pacifica TaxID=2860199 RepID=A0ABS7JK81_9SPHN|nr:TSUP family transporter [Qipengyuania aerophila]MBX7489796.1 TSUP family transporter [Qipengyuania aerophila]
MELTADVIFLLVSVAFLAGAIDSIAGGGGLLTVPALLAAGVPPTLALGTNKLQGTFGTATAAITFLLKGRVDFRRFLIPCLMALTGSACGALVLTRLDPAFLSGLIPVLLIAMAIYYALKPDLGDEDREVRARPALLVAVSLAIGFYDGFFGPGTGSFLTTALIALFGFGTVNAIAHTKLLNFCSNLASLIVLLAAGKVLIPLGLAMAAASMLGGYAGAHSTMRFGTKAVRPLLIIMCVALTIKLLWDPTNPITKLMATLFS